MQREGDTRTADEYQSHLTRLRQIVLDWQQGDIGVHDKRRLIADENARYYGEFQRGETGSDITVAPRVGDQEALSLADRARVPVEAAEAALHAWRTGSWDAEHADSLATARILREGGRRAYTEILNAAREP